MFSRYFSNTPFVLLSLMAPDAAQIASGASSAAPAQEPPVPQGATLEEKLQNASQIIKDFFAQLGGAMSERDTAVQNLATITAERDGAVQARDALTTERDNLNTQVGTLTTQVTGLTTERDTARDRVQLVESFAKGHGLDLTGIEKTGAVKDVPGGAEAGDEGKKLYDQYQALKADPKKSKQATAFRRKHAAALKDYADSLGD